MIIKPELVKKVKNYFDLNIYETKVWLALLSKGISSAGEIAEMSGVPRSRTYDVLESLEKQGFAIAKIGKPTKYIAVKPTIIIEKLKKNEFIRTDEKIKVLDNLKDTKEYHELEALHNSIFSQIKAEEISGAVKGKSSIISHIRSMLENAEKEVLISMPASDLTERKRAFNGIFDKFRERNIKLKLALNGKDKELKEISIKHNLKLLKTGINSRFFVVDRKQVLFSLNESANEEEEIAVWLNSEFFSNALAFLFEQSFKQG